MRPDAKSATPAPKRSDEWHRQRREIVRHFPTTTVKVTMYAFRWILLIILLYVILSMFMLFYIERYAFLTQIVTMSIGGFFAFFMGYFGWMFAQSIMDMLLQSKDKK